MSRAAAAGRVCRDCPEPISLPKQLCDPCRVAANRRHWRSKRQPVEKRKESVVLGVPGTAEMRFWVKIRIARSGCWEWTGAQDRGYPLFRAGRHARGHRWSYEHYRRPIPEGLVLKHRCNNRPCVNPWHLEPVAQDRSRRTG